MKSRDRNDRAGVPILSTCQRDLRRPKFASSCPAEVKLLLDCRSLKLVSSDFQRIVAAELAPKMDLTCRTKIACPHCGQSSPLHKATVARDYRNLVSLWPGASRSLSAPDAL